MTALGQSNAIEVSKPLPCPFCGSAPDVMELSSIGLRVGFKVACTTVAGCACCPETRVHATHAAAVKAWNTRADPVRAALAVPGLYFLTMSENLSLAEGDALVLIGALFWAGHVLAIGWLSGRQVEPVLLACLQFLICAVLSLAVAGFSEAATFTLNGLWDAALPILYGGLLSVGVAYTLQVVGQRHAPPAHAAIILSLETVFAALGGWLLLNETLSQRGLFGCGLMFGGMLLSQLGLGSGAPSPTEPVLASPALTDEQGS